MVTYSIILLCFLLREMGRNSMRERGIERGGGGEERERRIVRERGTERDREEGTDRDRERENK
jgi:hypothetical protein